MTTKVAPNALAMAIEQEQKRIQAEGEEFLVELRFVLTSGQAWAIAACFVVIAVLAMLPLFLH